MLDPLARNAITVNLAAIKPRNTNCNFGRFRSFCGRFRPICGRNLAVSAVFGVFAAELGPETCSHGSGSIHGAERT